LSEASASVVDGVLRLSHEHHDEIELPLVALRDRCRCPTCRHPSGQRLVDPASLPADLVATDVHVERDTIRVTWMPESHESSYAISDLISSSPPPGRAPTLWDATSEHDLPTERYPTIVGNDSSGHLALLRWLQGVQRMGCGLLHDVPTVDGEVTRVAELFGHVRETNYGRWFDVRSVVDPSNLANTSLGLAAHTDNPYRDPVPTVQLLHCLESTATGGENMLVDGWRVASEVRELEPAGFDLLVRRSVTFRYRDGTADLSAHEPLIELDTEGMVNSVRFNPRSMQDPVMRSEELAAWYDAYLLFARLVADARFQIRFRLDPGDLFIVDNRRVLHGRTAYEPTSGARHLQGCYADIDGLHSTVSMLQQECP
jgi:gamma-butyrobetaine dioxygenase